MHVNSVIVIKIKTYILNTPYNLLTNPSLFIVEYNLLLIYECLILMVLNMKSDFHKRF